MSIEKRSDLFREYARVIDMCEGTGVDPNGCVKYDGKPWNQIQATMYPKLTSQAEHHSFAVAILEGKPVFVGDEIYFKESGSSCRVDGIFVQFDKIPSDYSWNKPKRTFTLAGYKLPVPAHDPSLRVWKQVGDMKYYFDSDEDANNFSLIIQAIIHEAMENARLQNK